MSDYDDTSTDDLSADDTSADDYAVEDDTYDVEPEKTWDEGELGESDVIEAANHEGYTSVSDYVTGTDPHEPDA